MGTPADSVEGLAYLNGVFIPIAEAKVSIEDRGFQFGDGIYEVVAAYGGRPFLLDRHMARLRRSAQAIGLEYDFDRTPLEPIVFEGLQRCGIQEAMVYIQLTRGVAPRSHVIPKGLTPTLVMTFRRLPMVPDELRERGARLMTVPETRWAHCFIKAVTLLPNVLAKNEAIRAGYDDALFVTADGEVRECTSSNIFAVHGRRLRWPSRTEAVLHGVTQAFILESAATLDLSMQEESIYRDALFSADEVFISSTAVEVLGVTSIDGRPIGTGRVGPITRAIHQAFRERVPLGLWSVQTVERMRMTSPSATT
jgi:D-alanine transaminase